MESVKSEIAPINADSKAGCRHCRSIDADVDRQQPPLDVRGPLSEVETGPGIGDWRTIDELERGRISILVIEIGPRGELYQ